MSSLNGSWIEIFRAGDYGERGEWTVQDLDRLAAAYNPRLQPAPVVIGHPKDDAPAYGWVARLRRAGQSLWAQLEKVDAGFEKLLREGRFQQRSVALYRQFAPTGAPYLRHVGFLGAQPPAVKGLAPVRFTEDPQLEFTEPITYTEDTVTPNKLEKFFDHLRSFFAGDEDSGASATPEPSFSERLVQLEQRLETLSREKPAAAPVLSETEKEVQHSTIENFVETLRRRGSFPPAFDHLGVADFLHQLAELEAPAFACHSESAPADEESHPSQSSPGDRPGPGGQTLLVWFQEFLSQLPRVIEFNELTPGQGAGRKSTSPAARVIRFTEPRRGVEVDLASIELAERAETFAAEQGVSYAEALTQLRHSQRHTQTTA